MKTSRQILLLLALTGPAIFPNATVLAQKVYPRRTPIVQAYEKVAQAVVNISSSRVVTVSWGGFGADIFGEIFQMPGPFERTRRLTNLGSGFVIHRDGYVVTNYHVVARATDILVSMADKREFVATLLRADAEHDLAILKLNTDAPLSEITLGTTRDLMVGETVIAVGNPLGYHHTVTTGVASAVGRRLEFRSGLEYCNLIQTSAPINPGSSGGPLLNINGEVIGINTAIRSDAQNIGFAMSIDELTLRLGKLLRPRSLRQIGAGFGVALRRRDNQQELDVQVVQVLAGSPAQKAGIKPGDIVVGMAGTKIRSLADYYLAWQTAKVGRPISLDLSRSGSTQPNYMTVQLAPQYTPLPDVQKLAWEKLGLRLDTSKQPSSGKVGYRVIALKADGSVRQTDVRLGDVVFAIGRRELIDREALADALQEISPGQRVMFGWIRREVLGTVIRRALVRAQ